MLSNTAIVFLIAHVLADFYLQSPRLSADKDRHGKALALHMAIYAAVMVLTALALFMLTRDRRPVWAALSLSALHAAADTGKFFTAKAKRLQSPGAQAKIYVMDQLFHILCTVFIMNRFRFSLPIPGLALRWVLLISLIHKPANISFKKLLSKYDTADDANRPDTLAGAGAIIGSLERMLCAIFIGLGQYASIGLIYTAKSIARFKKIEENPRFAEYYLIGTLYSILFVVVCYLLVVNTL